MKLFTYANVSIYFLQDNICKKNLVAAFLYTKKPRRSGVLKALKLSVR